MPASMCILKTARVIYLRYTGVVRGEEMIETAREIAALSTLQTRYPVLLDLGLLTDVELTFSTLRRVVRKMDQLFTLRNMLGPQKTVVWAPGDIGYGMARMFDAVAQPDLRDLFLVETEAEALALLGLDAPDVATLAARG